MIKMLVPFEQPFFAKDGVEPLGSWGIAACCYGSGTSWGLANCCCCG